MILLYFQAFAGQPGTYEAKTPLETQTFGTADLTIPNAKRVYFRKGRGAELPTEPLLGIFDGNR